MTGYYESPASIAPHFTKEFLSRSAKTGVFYGIERPSIRRGSGLIRTIVEEALEAKLTHEFPKQDQILPHHTLTVLRGTTLGGGR